MRARQLKPIAHRAPTKTSKSRGQKQRYNISLRSTLDALDGRDETTEGGEGEEKPTASRLARSCAEQRGSSETAGTVTRSRVSAPLDGAASTSTLTVTSAPSPLLARRSETAADETRNGRATAFGRQFGESLYLRTGRKRCVLEPPAVRGGLVSGMRKR